MNPCSCELLPTSINNPKRARLPLQIHSYLKMKTAMNAALATAKFKALQKEKKAAAAPAAAP